MDPILRSYVIAGVVVAFGLTLGFFRRRPSAGVLALLSSGVCLFALGAFPKGDPLEALPGVEVARLGAALLMGALARAAGGPRLPVQRGLAAVVVGALLGGLNGAALIATLETDRARASRLALAAAAAGLLSPVGSPATLLLHAWPTLVPLALGMVALSLPGRVILQDKPVLPGRPIVTLLLLLVGVVAAVVSEPLWPLLGGCALLAVLARREFGALPRLLSFASVVWVIAAGSVVGLARASGLLWQAQQGLVYMEGRDGAVGLGVFLAAALVAMIGGELFAALAVSSLLGTWAGTPPTSLALPLIAGAAVGGLDAIFVSGGLMGAGMLRWLLRLGLALAWVALVV